MTAVLEFLGNERLWLILGGIAAIIAAIAAAWTWNWMRQDRPFYHWDFHSNPGGPTGADGKPDPNHPSFHYTITIGHRGTGTAFNATIQPENATRWEARKGHIPVWQPGSTHGLKAEIYPTIGSDPIVVMTYTTDKNKRTRRQCWNAAKSS